MQTFSESLSQCVEDQHAVPGAEKVGNPTHSSKTATRLTEAASESIAGAQLAVPRD